jgi:porphobilinogen synthase
MLTRPRRNRKSAIIRDLVKETRVVVSDLIYPLFVREGIKEAIPSLPGIYRHSLTDLLLEIEHSLKLGITTFALFPVIQRNIKCNEGKEALNKNGILLQAVREIKRYFPETCLISDIALDPYTLHGHDGIINSQGEVLNEESIEQLVTMALLHAEAGVDMVAPSDMMDGRVRAIREALDYNGFINVSIHAYSVKYASSLYGPYREACCSQLAFGDKRSYQMDPANKREASLEASLDEAEGADILMVKPATFYLDVIAKLREESKLPISAFQVSGEYAMLHAAAERGWLDLNSVLYESIISIKRAGAAMIFTYAAPKIATLL